MHGCREGCVTPCDVGEGMMLGGSQSWGSAAWATVNPVSVYVTADPPDAKARPGLTCTNTPSHGAGAPECLLHRLAKSPLPHPQSQPR